MAGSPQHATLVAETVTTLTIVGNAAKVEVTSVDGAAIVYFTVDGTTAPVVAATGTEVVPAVPGAWTQADIPTANDPSVIKLISIGTPKVSVRTW